MVLEGHQTVVDKYLVERHKEPLLYFVRNAFAHGIEPAAVRADHGGARRRSGQPIRSRGLGYRIARSKRHGTHAETARRVRRHRRRAHWLRYVDDLKRTSDAGFFAHLTKPTKVDALDRVLAKVFPELS